MTDYHKKINPIIQSFELDSNWFVYRLPQQTAISASVNEPMSPSLLRHKGELITHSAQVPGTVGLSLGIQLEDSNTTIRINEFDWLYETEFDVPNNCDDRIEIEFEGLATLTEIWLNDSLKLKTDNMFRRYFLNINDLAGDKCKLQIKFISVANYLNLKKFPRPRWKAKLAENQHLRWVRTTPLGMIDAWTPPIPIVGPWKPILINQHKALLLNSIEFNTYVDNGVGVIVLTTTLSLLDRTEKIDCIELEMSGQVFKLNYFETNESIEIKQTIRVENITHWSPHTHGTPHLTQMRILVSINNNIQQIYSKKIGFKNVKYDESQSLLSINNRPIFCRGVCWSGSNFLNPNDSRNQFYDQLTLLKDAGVNMIRIGGTMFYENDWFYDICDELGILVWQDFMFASMDYPFESKEFIENVEIEVNQQLSRLSKNCCVVIYCGNTDVEAQASMFGVEPTKSSKSFYTNYLPSLVKKFNPNTHYFPSSPSGGTLPFYLSEGITHYWGIGAYRKTIDDPNMWRVKFASEGMGQSHIASVSSTHKWLGKSRQPNLDRQWLSRIPKDLGAGWDFEQIRDYYLEQLFNIDAQELRRINPNKHLFLSRITTGEILSHVFRVWRSSQSQCNGGLIWFSRDFWPSAGFGIIDSFDQPKPAYYPLKRMWAPLKVLVLSNGFDGCEVEVVNDLPLNFNGKLSISLVRFDGVIVSKNVIDILIEKHSRQRFDIDAILGAFYDSSYSYRFGEASFDILTCEIIDSSGATVSDDFYFSNGYQTINTALAKIESEVTRISDYNYSIKLISNKFLQFVELSVSQGSISSNYFHMIPNKEYIVYINIKATNINSHRVSINALNLELAQKIKLTSKR